MLKYGIITVSDKGSSGEREDKSAPAIREVMKKVDSTCEIYKILPDERSFLEEEMKSLCDSNTLDVIFTTGGTGFAPRDITPEATRSVVNKLAPGLTEAMRAKSMEITPKAMLSRAVAGIRGNTLLVNLPGSPKAVQESIEVILPALPHGVELLRGEGGECAR